MNLSPKHKFDKTSLRGLVYTVIALAGIGYELFFSQQVRPFLIIMYSIVVFIGIYYIRYFRDQQ